MEICRCQHHTLIGLQRNKTHTSSQRSIQHEHVDLHQSIQNEHVDLHQTDSSPEATAGSPACSRAVLQAEKENKTHTWMAGTNLFIWQHQSNKGWSEVRAIPSVGMRCWIPPILCDVGRHTGDIWILHGRKSSHTRVYVNSAGKRSTCSSIACHMITLIIA